MKPKMTERKPNDLYRTDLRVIQASLKRYAPISANGYWALDVGAGDGRWGQALLRINPRAYVVGVEKRRVKHAAGYAEWRTGSFLDFRSNRPYRLIFGNPPFKIAEGCIRKSSELISQEDGTILFMLPLNFLSGIERNLGLFQTHPTYRVDVLCPRPGFYGTGTARGREYAIFVWRKVAGMFMTPIGPEGHNVHYLAWKDRP